MFVRGVVGDIEYASGTIDAPGQPAGTGTPWSTAHAVLSSGERVKFRIKQDGTLPVPLPEVGDLIEVLVDLELKQQPNSLLQPFKLVLVALEATVLESADDRAQARTVRSVESSAARRPVGKKTA